MDLIRTLFAVTAVAFAASAAKADWNVALDLSAKPVTLHIKDLPVEIIGEIRGEEIGVAARGGQQYGVQGGGLASAFVMLAIHAAAVQGQRSEQEEKVWQEAKLFGRPLTAALQKKTSMDVFILSTQSASDFAGEKLTIRPLEDKASENVLKASIDLWSSRDYKGLIVDLTFLDNSSQQPALKIQVSANKDFPLINDEGRVVNNIDMDQEIALLVQEALRIYFRRDKWVGSRGTKQVTFRSLVGDEKRFERGYLLSSTCDRHLFEDLTGRWISRNRMQRDTEDVRCRAMPITIAK
jgi:hypothetical protein